MINLFKSLFTAKSNVKMTSLFIMKVNEFHYELTLSISILGGFIHSFTFCNFVIHTFFVKPKTTKIEKR